MLVLKYTPNVLRSRNIAITLTHSSLRIYQIFAVIAAFSSQITAKFRQISKEECVRVIDSFARPMEVCLQRRGAHLKHI